MPYKSAVTETQNYSSAEGKLNEALRGINPCELKQVDEIIQDFCLILMHRSPWQY